LTVTTTLRSFVFDSGDSGTLTDDYSMAAASDS
jgi:hypothetical protein